jgi:Amidohydrolase family
MLLLRLGSLSILLGVSHSWADSPAVPQTLRYTILGNSAIAGSEVDTYGPGGSVDSTYQFNDRGRGPKIAAHYVLRADGLPSLTDLTGNDYLKAPVNEQFSIENGAARWKSTSENGQASAGFYISINGPAAEAAFLVAALLKAKGAPVKLLPAGEARLERLTDVTVEDQGRKLHVTEFGITGLSFEPQTIWLDDDQRFFASPGKSSAILREGWEGANDRLYALDRAAEDARNARLAGELAQHLNHPLALEHVRVFDSEHAIMREDQTVVINKERITMAGPSASVTVPKDAQRMNGTGETLLPGLFDMHVHVQALDGLLNIASGVTNVRDMGSDIDELKHLQDQWDNGEAIGPRLSKAGVIDGRGPFQAPSGLYADTAEEAQAEVNRYADLGYVQIKVYSSLKPELFSGIVKIAHARGLRVSGHIPNGMIASQFVEAGADEIQHINFIFLNFFASLVKDTRGPERFTAVAANAATLDLDSKEVNEFIGLLQRHHTTVDVTLAAFEGMFTGRPGKVSPDYAPVLDRLPAQIQRAAYTGGLAVTEQSDQLYKDSYAAMLRMTKRMYDAGIPILAGTDSTAGFMLHRELELEVKAGIPPAKALQIATINAARLLKKENDLGSIAPGKLADFVLVEGNPGEHISDIRRCRLVAKNGVLYKSAEVYRAIGVKPN